jgi:heme exporter protein B
MNPNFVSKVGVLITKDLRMELRGRDTLPPMLAFSAAVTLLLAFSLPGTSVLTAPLTLPTGTVPYADVLAGFFWVTVLFAGLVGFSRTFEVERAEGAIDSLLLVPLDRSGLFLSKAAANLIFIALVQMMLLPLFFVFFNIDLGGRVGTLLLVVILADLGFVAVGTLFSALAAQTSSRELMLPILALPALVPVFIAAVELTSDLFIGGGMDVISARGWFGILLAFDLIFGIVGTLVFEFALDS